MSRGRPALLLLAAFGAGLATGLSHFWVPAGAGMLLAGVAWVAGREALWPVGAVLLGVLHGGMAGRAAAFACDAVLPPGPIALEARLVDPSGGSGRLLPVGGCRGAIQVRWPPWELGEHAAGMTVRVTGVWRRTTGGPRVSGVLLIRQIEPLGGRPGWVARLRTSAERSIATLFGARAPVVEAVLLGRRDGLDPGLRDAFADAGLVHLLAISGFHVGLVAGWLFLLLRLCRVRGPVALLLAAIGAVGYAAFLGWPAPATRAALLALLAALGRARQRRVDPESLLAVALLLVLLLDPWALLEVGAWLSGAAVAGVIAASRWARTWAPGRWSEALAASIGATLATAPVTTFAFGTVSLVGVGLNLAAIPLAGIAVPGALASVVAHLAGLPADGLAAGAGLALLALERLARLGASVPMGVIVSEPGWGAALPWVGAMVCAAWVTGVSSRGPGATKREAGRRLLWASAVGSWALLLASWPGSHENRGLALHFLDVGQGDAAAIRTPGGHWILVDAGSRSGRSDAGRRVVVPFLRRSGVRALDALVVSHAHLDHLGGARAVLGRFRVGNVIEPGDPVDDPAYLDFLAQIDSAGAGWTAGRPGLAWTVDGVRFSVLAPDTTRADFGLDLNEDSVVLLVQYGEFEALFAGDAGLPAEEGLWGRVGAIEVLKVGHHGSRGASGQALLAEAKPEVAVISVGTGNRYGHPSPEALRRIRAAGADVWRTDTDGTVTVTVEPGGRRFTVTGRGRRHGYSVHAAPRVAHPMEAPWSSPTVP